MNAYEKLFADRILKICKERGITPNRLATMSGIRQSTINNILCGASKNPRIKTLHKIALAFGMTPSEFLDFQALNDYAFDEEEISE